MQIRYFSMGNTMCKISINAIKNDMVYETKYQEHQSLFMYSVRNNMSILLLFMASLFIGFIKINKEVEHVAL